MTLNTIYDPSLPLNKQLERAAPPTIYTIGMDPMTIGAPPLELKEVSFKPLQINNIILNITLESRTAVDQDEEGIYFYEKMTFQIKSSDSKYNYSEVAMKNIEDTIQHIYNSSTAYRFAFSVTNVINYFLY